MPAVRASLEFLADIPLYEYEKPYLVLLPAHDGSLADTRMDNLEWETHGNMLLRDIREHWNSLTIERCGFQAIVHQSAFLHFDSISNLDAYRKETESLLRKRFRSSHVVCYDLKVPSCYRANSASRLIHTQAAHRLSTDTSVSERRQDILSQATVSESSSKSSEVKSQC